MYVCVGLTFLRIFEKAVAFRSTNCYVCISNLHIIAALYCTNLELVQIVAELLEALFKCDEIGRYL